MSATATSLPSVSTNELPCAKCGYDLRAQPRDGICPECETPVEKAIELAAVPLRPAWRDSDPRWRRRMLAGAWIMVLYPVLAVLQWSGMDASVPVAFYDFQGFSVETLETSFLTFVYPYLAFCVGVVLFFSKERRRRRNPLDWSRRWGVIASYAVLLVGVPFHAVITALVMVGIGASFMSLPFENQPAVTGVVTDLGAGYLLYGPHGSDALPVALAAFSACTVLLACVPIYDALRCSGPKRMAQVVLVPLALIAVWQIAGAALWYLNAPRATFSSPPTFFFQPGFLVSGLTDLESVFRWPIPLLVSFTREAAKWLVFLGIAIWLSLAQVRAWRKSPMPKSDAP